MLFENKYNIPEKIIWWIIAFCVLPLILNLFGINFGLAAIHLSPYRVLKLFEFEHEEGIREILHGRAIHTIFVSLSMAIAFLTVVLAFIDFRIKGEVSTPIVGVALFCSGLLETFHILISTRILDTPSQQYYITSFTWFFCRLFHALILIFGVGIFLVRSEFFSEQFKKGARRFVYYITVIFVLLTLSTIVILFFDKDIPEIRYPYRNISRTYDLVPLGLYIVAGW